MAPTLAIFVAFLALGMWDPKTVQVQGGCPQDCLCPGLLPEGCAQGVPLVPDDCGCGCQVCAGQLNEDCDDLRPCDPQQDLLCDYGADPERQEGICRASGEGRSCFFNGSVYQHEERFDVACHSSCVCRDGTLGCVPRCPPTVPVMVPGCSDMRQVEVSGQCCKEWRCVESNALEDWLVGVDVVKPPGENVIGVAREAGPEPSRNRGPGRPHWRYREQKKAKALARVTRATGAGDQDGSSAASGEGRFCSVDGAIYQHGAHFQIACQGSCICQDGGISCVSLCPPSQPPMVPGCKVMQQVEVPGQCCKRWSCLEFSNELPDGALRLSWGTDPQGEPGAKRRSRTLSSQSTVMSRRKRAKGKKRSSSDVAGCQKEPTEWSQCSKMCGMGTSTRLVWSNTTCTPHPEKQLCMVRPCGDFLQDSNFTVVKSGKKCTRLVRPLEPQTWTFKGCWSQRPLIPNYCGSCSDGRGCAPSRTRTIRMKFQCEGGAAITRNVMWVQNCGCEKRRRNVAGEKALKLGEMTQTT